MTPGAMSQRLRIFVGGAVLLGLALAILAADLTLPLGFNVAYLYAVVVIGAGLSRDRRMVIGTAALLLAFTAAAYFAKSSSPEDVPTSLVLFGRASAVLLICLTALVVTVLVARDRAVSHLGTALVEAEAENAASERLVTATRKLSPIGTWSFDFNESHRMVWSNEVAAIHGREAGTAPTLDEALAYFAADDATRIAQAIDDAGASGAPFMEEGRITAADGRSRAVLLMGQVSDDPRRGRVLHGVTQDVTLWRDAESAAAVQSRRFNQLASAMPYIMWTAAVGGEVDYVNDAAARFTGLAAEDLVGNGWLRIVHPDDRTALKDSWAPNLDGFDTTGVECRLLRDDGEYRWHRVGAQPERDERGEVSRWWGYAIDIHIMRALREEADDAARERDMVLTSITDGVYMLDREWRFRYLNPAAEALVERHAAELVGKVFWDEFPEEAGTALEEVFRTAMTERQVARLTNDSASVERQFDIVASPSELGITVFFRDTTEVRKLNAQLAHAQRLESVGRLTGGIAHDFNNLLTVVIGGAEALESDPALGDESRELAGLVGQAARRGAELTHHLLAFARRQPLEPRPTDIVGQLHALVPMLRRTLGEAIAIDAVTPVRLPLVTVDPGQLDNALLNLAINARDAMPGGGTLTLEAAPVTLDRAYATAHGDVEAGSYVAVTVSDSGEGIDPEHLQRLFDPFFTTKEAGRGSGLGLAMVWGFAKQSGGHVSVYSELGHGTSFRLYLPLANGEVSDEQHVPLDVPLPERGSGHILLAEDDPLVRAFAADQLGAHGFSVTVAASGPEALAALEGMEQLDLLFTDVIMPGGMTGRELAQAVEDRRPGTPVLYSSGYTENVIVHNGRLDPGVTLLAKPYSTRQLLTMVHAVLSNHGRTSS